MSRTPLGRAGTKVKCLIAESVELVVPAGAGIGCRRLMRFERPSAAKANLLTLIDLNDFTQPGSCAIETSQNL
jgi:hypothetical protein